MRCEEAKLASAAMGGVTKLARALGVAPQAISQWKRIPAGRVLQIEAATDGRVPRHALRPDLYPAPERDAAEPAAAPAEGDELAPTAGAAEPPGGADRAEPEEAAAIASAAAASAPIAAAQTRALSRRAFLAVVVLIFVFASGVAAWPFLLPRLGITLPSGLVAPDPGLMERMTRLEARLAEAERPSGAEGAVAEMDRLGSDLDALDAGLADLALLRSRLDALEARPAPSAEGAPPAAGEGLAQRLAALERAFAGLAEEAARVEDLGPDTAEFVARLRALAHRLAALEEAALAGTGGEAALALVVGQLRQALAGSGPYAGALSTVEALADRDPALAAAIARLEAHAAKGVPTPDQLRARFAALAGEIVRAEARARAQGWLGATLDRLYALVSIRRTGEVEGRGAEARVARAELRLGAGDLGGAVAEVEGLDGAAARAAADWLGAARARLAAEDALKALEARAIARLKSPGSKSR